MPQPRSPAEFVAKWSTRELSERAASQSHFNDLCELLGQPSPTDHDATGDEYTFEKGVAPTGVASRGSVGRVLGHSTNCMMPKSPATPR